MATPQRSQEQYALTAWTRQDHVGSMVADTAHAARTVTMGFAAGEREGRSPSLKGWAGGSAGPEGRPHSGECCVYSEMGQ